MSIPVQEGPAIPAAQVQTPVSCAQVEGGASALADAHAAGHVELEATRVNVEL